LRTPPDFGVPLLFSETFWNEELLVEPLVLLELGLPPELLLPHAATMRLATAAPVAQPRLRRDRSMVLLQRPRIARL
jgi:hypothetical protein